MSDSKSFPSFSTLVAGCFKLQPSIVADRGPLPKSPWPPNTRVLSETDLVVSDSGEPVPRSATRCHEPLEMTYLLTDWELSSGEIETDRIEIAPFTKLTGRGVGERVGLLLTVPSEAVRISSLLLNVYDGDSLLFRTLSDCPFSKMVFQALPPGERGGSYIFLLDEDAIEASAHFLTGNSRLSVSIDLDTTRYESSSHLVATADLGLFRHRPAYGLQA